MMIHPRKAKNQPKKSMSRAKARKGTQTLNTIARMMSTMPLNPTMKITPMIDTAKKRKKSVQNVHSKTAKKNTKSVQNAAKSDSVCYESSKDHFDSADDSNSDTVNKVIAHDGVENVERWLGRLKSGTRVNGNSVSLPVCLSIYRSSGVPASLPTSRLSVCP
jgi:hypothetical protein